jgi:hypothetical protein
VSSICRCDYRSLRPSAFTTIILRPVSALLQPAAYCLTRLYLLSMLLSVRQHFSLMPLGAAGARDFGFRV